MSYWATLVDPETGEPLQASIPHDLRGGTFTVGGEPWLTLNVTYNYGVHLWPRLGEGGLRRLHGMLGSEALPLLEKARDSLGTDESEDYWEPTEGNVRKAVEHLIALSKMAPHGRWEIS